MACRRRGASRQLQGWSSAGCVQSKEGRAAIVLDTPSYRDRTSSTSVNKVACITIGDLLSGRGTTPVTGSLVRGQADTGAPQPSALSRGRRNECRGGCPGGGGLRAVWPSSPHGRILARTQDSASRRCDSPCIALLVDSLHFTPDPVGHNVLSIAPSHQAVRLISLTHCTSQHSR